MARPSLDLQAQQSVNVARAKTLQKNNETSNLQLVKKSVELNNHELEGEGGLEVGHKDPAIVAMDVAAQMVNYLLQLLVTSVKPFQSYLRKLKFQYLEQNAKDKYVKSIVSDIDDAPIVTAEDNKRFALAIEEKKDKLKTAKSKLGEVQSDIRLLAPMVENGQPYAIFKLYIRTNL